MNRRYFLTLFGGAATVSSTFLPPAARAQQPPMLAIGYLQAATLETTRGQVEAFHRGLAETGYVEGRNLTIEYRWADGQFDRLPRMAADLVRRQVAALFAGGPPPALAAKG